ncbi:MAG: amidohydrolase family protein, partial [Acidimicrobiaceae bacterium]|nr:amidohydrolase family protein [Acidimicrobiaceae bacterium]
MRVLIGGARLATPREVVDHAWLAIEGDRVTGVGQGRPPGQADVDLAGGLVVPGFVDLHCHGGGGGSYADGPDEAATAASFHRAHGTTTTLASLVSAGPPDLLYQVKQLADMVHEGVVAGIHLEGPWLSELRCGAHDPAVLRDPTEQELDALVEAAGGTLAMVTLAPERTNAIELIRGIAGAGMVAAVGHTNATFAATVAAINAGARVATHLGNAMAPMHQREPGPLLALLDDPRVVCEVINDGRHVHPAFVQHVRRSAGSA